MTFKVKPGVELPPARRAGRARKYPFDTLAVGELFFVPDQTTANLTTYASLQGRKLGRKFRTQMAIMRQDLETDEWEVCQAGAPGAKNGVAIERVS